MYYDRDKNQPERKSHLNEENLKKQDAFHRTKNYNFTIGKPASPRSKKTSVDSFQDVIIDAGSHSNKLETVKEEPESEKQEEKKSKLSDE